MWILRVIYWAGLSDTTADIRRQRLSRIDIQLELSFVSEKRYDNGSAAWSIVSNNIGFQIPAPPVTSRVWPETNEARDEARLIIPLVRTKAVIQIGRKLTTTFRSRPRQARHLEQAELGGKPWGRVDWHQRQFPVYQGQPSCHQSRW